MISGLVSLLFAFRHFHVYFIIHFRITRSPRPRSFRSGNKLYRFYRYSFAHSPVSLSLPLSAYGCVREMNPRNKFTFPISIFRRTKRHRRLNKYTIHRTVCVVSFKLFGCYVNGMHLHFVVCLLSCIF